MASSPSSFEIILQLKGNSTHVTAMPAVCPQCSCKEFYKQSDFNRSLGLIMVTLASIGTVVLMVLGFNWFVVWSPMVVVLGIDFALLRMRPVVAICYRCKHVLRGVPVETLEELEGFDLVTYDRYKYVEENKAD